MYMYVFLKLKDIYCHFTYETYVCHLIFELCSYVILKKNCVYMSYKQKSCAHMSYKKNCVIICHLILNDIYIQA